MNSISRGVRNAFRNLIRTGSIVAILALSIGLVIAMLAARQAVTEKIQSVKASVGTTITVSPAGFRDFSGGGNPLTSDQLTKVAAVSNVTGVTEMLSDRLTSSNTSLESAIQAGALGQRFGGGGGFAQDTNGSAASSTTTSSASRSFTPPVTVTGTNDVSGTAAFSGSSASITSGAAFDATKDADVALVGKELASKNSLSVGSTFTAYGATIKVVGIFDTGTTFGNDGVVMPLITLQRLSGQTGDVTSAVVTVNSLDNLATATNAIKTILGSSADVTNSQDAANQAVQPLESVQQISLFSLIGAVVAGAVIILLTMVMIVRERRREVGVMKAIGASNLRVMWQFVVEALTLTVLGLVIGLGIGIVAAAPLTTMLVDNSQTSSVSQNGPTNRPGAGTFRALRDFGQTSSQTIRNIQTSVGSSTLGYGMGAALLIAVFGSAIPSFLISKIKPADAMRNE